MLYITAHREGGVGSWWVTNQCEWWAAFAFLWKCVLSQRVSYPCQRGEHPHKQVAVKDDGDDDEGEVLRGKVE